METSLRPRRSVLYMPGSNPRALEKAKSLDADALILDMEDAVSPDAKAEARSQISAAVKAGGYAQRELIVRVNGLDTEWGEEDLACVANLPVDAVLLPKVNSPTDIDMAVEVLKTYGAPDDLPIWIMAETTIGIFNIESIAAHPRLRGIVMGTSDLAKEMRVRHTADRVGLLVPLSLSVMAARAHGRDIVDGVYLNLDDAEGFKAACEQGRDMGFDGKTLIHPKQLAASNEVFAPTTAEVEHAKAVLEAWEAAQKEGKGVVVVNGRLVENLHCEEAKRQLALAAAIAARSL